VENGSPLNAAASLGAEDVGIRLLEAGARADLLGLFGETALHWAAHLGASHLVNRLVQAGSPLDVKDRKYNSTPLGWAIHGWRSPVPPPWVRAGIAPRHVEVVARLVSAGAVVAPSWLEAEEVRADARMLAALQRAAR
jgi:ankyrin repeat protein